MKVLFLDFDGVLNTESYQVLLHSRRKIGWDDLGPLFDPEAVGNLKRILDAIPDLRIVLESSWKAQGLDELRLMWKERSLPGELFDVTPDIFNEELLAIDLADPDSFRKMESLGKGREISSWLRKRGGQDCRYVILDDVAEFYGDLARHHVRTDPKFGITREDALKVIAYLTTR